MAPKRPQRSARSHRSTLSLQKTEIIINVYDLLAPGRLSSFLWTVGTSLLHSGVVINGKEYAYGGHDRPGVTGVYWTRPRTEPPGGMFKCEILHGFSLAPQEEIDSIVRGASEEFQGTSYNLLTKNCNHFTAHLVERLTGRSSPGWLNRAASIGMALPCVVPKEWIEPPDHESGHELALDDDDEPSESSSMLGEQHAAHMHLLGVDEDESAWQDQDQRRHGEGGGNGSKRRAGQIRDDAGRVLPAAEVAPAARRP